MRAGIAAFAGGVILLYCVGEIPPWPGVVIALVISMTAWLTASFTQKSVIRKLALLLIYLCAGLAWAGWMSSERLAIRLPHALEDGIHSVEGYRCSLVEPGAYSGLRFNFCVTRWLGDSPQYPVRVNKLRLALYGADPGTVLPEQLRLKVRLKSPHGGFNPAGFRYETWLFRHGIGATGSIRSWEAASVSCGIVCHYNAARESVAGALRSRYGDIEAYPLVEALLLGERRFLSADDWSLFRETGTSHLVAISGLHIGLVGLFVGGIVGAVLRRLQRPAVSPRWQRRLVVISSLVACTGYALLAGFTVPTQRALVMAGLAGFLYLRAYLSGYWTAWLWALGAVLIIDPFAPLDGGFWLSFGAVACLVFLFAGRLQAPGPVKAILLAQAGVVSGLLPVLASLGLPVTVLGWLVNIIAIPLMSFVLLPLLFLLAPVGLLFDPLSSWAGIGINALLMVFIHLLEFFASVSPDGIRPPMALACVAGSLLLACLFPLKNRSRLVLIAIVSSLLIGHFRAGKDAAALENPAVAVPELWIWDVGQGLAVTYREGRKVLQFDTGPGSPAGYTAVDSVIRPTLRRFGVNHLDWLIVSHGDADHASGLRGLLDHYSPELAISGEPNRVTRRAGARDSDLFRRCKTGTHSFGDSTVEFWQDPQASGGNAASCVVRLIHGDTAIVLPGDITDEQEKRWLADHELIEGRNRIVVAPHHGSGTSSSRIWVNRLAPDIVVFSAGYRHPYGHPAADVQARYRKAGSQLYNTASAGAIRIRLGDGGVSVRRQRAVAPFWIDPMSGELP